MASRNNGNVEQAVILEMGEPTHWLHSVAHRVIGPKSARIS